jgi:hypothetical protein
MALSTLARGEAEDTSIHAITKHSRVITRLEPRSQCQDFKDTLPGSLGPAVRPFKAIKPLLPRLTLARPSSNNRVDKSGFQQKDLARHYVHYS